MIEFDFISKRNLTPNARSCTICQEDFLAGVTVVLLQCMHRYHKECITEWIK